MNDTLKRSTTLSGSCLVVSGEEFFSSLFFFENLPWLYSEGASPPFGSDRSWRGHPHCFGVPGERA